MRLGLPPEEEQRLFNHSFLYIPDTQDTSATIMATLSRLTFREISGLNEALSLCKDAYNQGGENMLIEVVSAFISPDDTEVGVQVVERDDFNSPLVAIAILAGLHQEIGLTRSQARQTLIQFVLNGANA